MNVLVIVLFGMMALLALMMIVCYALLVVASRADEREEQFYKEWKEKDDGKTVQSADE